MPQRFETRGYNPELVSVMKAALDSAWIKVRAAPSNMELARLVLASAIIDAVDAGVRDPKDLAARALAALAGAARITGETLGLSNGPDTIPIEDLNASNDE